MTPKRKTERDDQIIRLLLSGIDPKVIANQIGVHVSTIYSIVKARSIERLYVTPDERAMIRSHRSAQ